MKKCFEFGKMVVKGFLDNHCTMHAAGLTYFSLLTIVPILCVLLLAAKTFHADEYVKELVSGQIDAVIVNIESGQEDSIAAVAAADETVREERRIIAQEFGKQARMIRDQLFERIDQFDVGTLGWVGFLVLLWTVINSIGMVEVSLNEIWKIAKSRPIWKRASLYLFVSIVVPVFVALAMSLPILNIVKNVIVTVFNVTDLTKWVSDGLICLLESTALRLLITLSFSSVAFAFVFSVMPNCRVTFRHAWRGGVVTALMFGAWIKICAIAQVGIARSSALYGSLAFVPIVLAWIYMSWQVFLFGANIVYAQEVIARLNKEENLTKSLKGKKGTEE